MYRSTSVSFGCLLLTVGLTLTCSPARAALIAYDGFGDTGSINGTTTGTGFSGAWFGASANDTLASGSLAMPSGHLPESGGHVAMTGVGWDNWEHARRPLSQTISTDATGTYYMSYVCAAATTTWLYPLLWDGTNTIGAGVHAGNSAIYVNGAETYGASVNTDPVMYVIKIVTRAADTAHRVDLYLKTYSTTDTLPTTEPTTWDATATYTATSEKIFNSIYVLTYNPVSSQLDELRLATTWGEAMTTPEPSTIVMLAFGLIGLLAYAWRKRR